MPQAGWCRHTRTAPGPGYRPYSRLRRQKMSTRARLNKYWIAYSLAVPCMVITATEYSVKPPSLSAHLAEVCTNMTGLNYSRLQQALRPLHQTPRVNCKVKAPSKPQAVEAVSPRPCSAGSRFSRLSRSGSSQQEESEQQEVYTQLLHFRAVAPSSTWFPFLQRNAYPRSLGSLFPSG